jgi:HD-GYP domain-containing protein (c-di-GMP phosphodiesterase class II)
MMHRDPIATEAEAREALAILFPARADREKGARVAATAAAIAHHFPMSVGEREALAWAGRLHGLCRLLLPEAILSKPAPLSGVELNIVRRAPSEAFELLLDHPFLSNAGYLLRSIRERQDGRGYPDGLVGAAIPLGSRILTVADAIEAITHEQRHLPARSPTDAVLELLRCEGTQFDADVVHAAVQVIAGYVAA